MTDKITYSQAIEELEAIVSEIENEDISVDELSEKVKRASHLIQICKDALHSTEEEVKRILEELNQEKT
ncbi:MAG: exodeoxyribonuclease VII small subunit [Bacteroides sp.]|jgi:exodeoxyribonuclease VII small subunit|nr:exodeoxyribonuclease VII small subunit [Bacteroides sp.]